MEYRQQFFVPTVPVSWNRITTAHWRQYKRLKDEMGILAFFAIKEAGIRPYMSPIEIEVHAKKRHKRKFDLDNLYFKAVQDQLVELGIVKDDTLDHITKISYTGEVGADRDGLLVTLCPISI